jgi:aminoglycoside phosphotransferase (APT) family kinase protein
MGDDTTRFGGREYSRRLGILTPGQFQAALTRFELGDFVAAEPVSRGLFGQNVFVTSIRARYVLRGVPHYDWQFPKERFGARLLHSRTCVPVAHPYLLDETSDIFGWPYLIMPRLPGISPPDEQLGDGDRLAIARALGHNLAEVHALVWPFAGGYDLATDTVQPFAEGYEQWLAADVRAWLERARGHGATTPGPPAWVERLLHEARPALAEPFEPCCVLNDYNPGNVLVDNDGGAWRVTGLFDLMEYYFGDGEADLMRLIATYLDCGRAIDAQLAHAFGSAYLERRPPRPGFAARYRLFMARDRLIAWEFGTRPGMNWFAAGQSFRSYAEPYVASWRLFDDA